MRQITFSPGRKLTAPMRFSSRRFEDWSARARSAARRQCSGCASSASTTCAPVSRNPWKRHRTGGGRMRSPAAADIAPNSAVSSPIPSAGCGPSRRPKPNAVTSRDDHPGAVRPRSDDRQTRPALYPGVHQKPGELRPPGQAAQAGSGRPGTTRSVILGATAKSLPRGDPFSGARRCGSGRSMATGYHTA